jgi:hypothetical protein
VNPLAVDPSPLYVLAGVIFTTLLGYIGKRLSDKAQARQGDAQTDLSAGALALQIAQRADTQSQQQERRLNRLDRWRRSVIDEWWPQHDARDRALEQEVTRLDPSFTVLPRVPLPGLDDDERSPGPVV